VAEPADGQVLVRNRFLSLDPYMRGRMNDAKSYAKPQPLNEVMGGGTVGEVVASKHPSYQPGRQRRRHGRLAAVFAGRRVGPGVLRKVDASRIPLSAYLGAVGMPGRHRLVRPDEDLRAEAGPDDCRQRRQRRGRQRRRPARQGARLPRGRHRRRRRQVRLRDRRARLRRLHRLQGAGRQQGPLRGAEGSDARRRRRQLRERRRRHPRRDPGADECVRPDRPVRNDQRLRRAADPDAAAAAAAAVAAAIEGFIVSEHMEVDEIAGALVGLDADEVVVARDDARAGRVHVHFPRIGFHVKAAKKEL
jgi:hypothetical protein